eukprot:TRINITY_DN1640_c0_g1_i2.p1 TRINITY_DN1640_c0_g1~~TRINITY_DN1640_c0_g1_i2.p1  ORF type:complete len:180 (+),score=17.26 TRINITY_DN1640_c0_g1_i2:143-682(+)
MSAIEQNNKAQKQKLAEYREQLEHVEEALLSSPNEAGLLSLKADLNEVIFLSETILEKSPWKVGDRCLAPFSDGQIYEAVIASITEGDATIRFYGYGNSLTVPLKQLESPTGIGINKRKVGGEVITIPDSLVLLSSDSEAVVKSKKRKIKVLKYQTKQDQIVQEHNVKKTKWPDRKAHV